MHVEYKFQSRPPRDNPLNSQKISRVLSQRGQKKKKKIYHLRTFVSPYISFPFLRLIGLKSVFHKDKKKKTHIKRDNQ